MIIHIICDDWSTALSIDAGFISSELGSNIIYLWLVSMGEYIFFNEFILPGKLILLSEISDMKI